MSFLLSPSGPSESEPLPGREYLIKLQKYLKTNLTRLAPGPISRSPSNPSILQQSYTLLTLGLDPNSQPLSNNIKIPLTFGFGQPSTPSPPRTPSKPILLRLPPDRLLYLLLRWQSLPQGLPHVGRTDVPIAPGVPVAARGARSDERVGKEEGDVRSVRSWVGSMRSVSIGSLAPGRGMGMGWFSKKEEVNEDQILLALYSIFTVLPALLIHPPFISDRPIAELVDAGGYTQLGGIDVRVPLDVLRNLQVLELEGYDPRGLLMPPNPGLRSLTVRSVQDADDWLDELLVVPVTDNDDNTDSLPPSTARFPNLRHLSLPSTTLLSFPSLPLSRLTSLDLSYNLLNTIPPSLSSLHSLVSLNLSNNLITSVRNAPSVLGNITSLNLASNRCDCLVGLERVLGLERVDVRDNLLSEWDEVGRLAVLPHIKAIWCTGNPFDRDNKSGDDDWRVDLGVAFAIESKSGGDGEGSVIFDDRPFSWSESRRIESEMASKGHLSHSRGYTTAAKPTTTSTNQQYDSIRSHIQSERSRPTTNTTTASVNANPNSPAPSIHLPPYPNSPASSAAIHKKRRPRRVINLDDTAENPVVGRVSGGSVRLPPKTRLSGTSDTIEEEDRTKSSNANSGPKEKEKERKQGEQGEDGQGKVSMPKRSGRRARVSASMFEPITKGDGNGNQ
ncbi:hypothetical protein BCR39DRAFT_589822 [Naematelia encephala]|uniref:Uncharacterized protein n=1 Tax=Naematelia encephala TaxID=71784 RepID=A0A1Y2AW79_9TREE|nr:hypothetical protein BCR39DRAFT_589822 [Naematelia encephala]